MLNYLYTHQLVYCCTVLLCSGIISYVAIPSILHVARKRHLYDDLGHFRKEHDHGIPRLGGVAMFVSFTITTLMFGMINKELPVNCLITACIILLAVGLKDDLSGVNPSTKFLIQFIMAFVLVIGGDIRITEMHGVLGIGHLPYILSVLFTVFCIILVINAFNLIDGVDGLAGSLGIMANGLFAALFIYMQQYQLAAVALSIVGAIFGFLKYNITPAKIFMGDTGSLLIGLISVVMGIELVEHSPINPADSEMQWLSAPVLVVAAFITPLFDTCRVFMVRLAAGNSPFKADRNHTHHRMLKLGLTHLQTTFILVGANLLVIGIVSGISSMNATVAILCTVLCYMLFNWVLTFLIRSKERETLALRNLFV